MRSGKKKRRVSEKGELFQVVHKGEVIAEKTYPSEGAALSFTQDLMRALALGEPRDEDIDYIVRLKPVLGPPDDLYLVRLTPEGATFTAPASAIRT